MQRRVRSGRRAWRPAILAPVLVVVTLAGLLASPAEATVKRAFCRQPWGIHPKQLGNNAPGFPPTVLTGVSATSTACYDRLVFDLGGPAIGYRVEYVPAVTEDASGRPIPLRGGAFLQIVLAAPASNGAGRPTYLPSDRSNVVDVRTCTTFRQAAFGGSFEGLTTFGLGVRAKLPFRVVVLPGPGSRSRIAVDVSHRWI